MRKMLVWFVLFVADAVFPIESVQAAATINFGTETVGVTSPPQSDLLVSTGDQPLIVGPATIALTSAQGSVSDFQIGGNLGTQILAPGAVASFSPTFTPSVAGTETATLSILVQGVAALYTVTLVGQGAAATKIVEFSPSNAVFPDQVLGTPSATRTIFIFNTGSLPFTVDRVQAAGDFEGDRQPGRQRAHGRAERHGCGGVCRGATVSDGADLQQPAAGGRGFALDRCDL